MPAATRDGVRLHYRREGHGEPAMVLVHGWCCDNTFFGPLVDHFAPGWTLVLPDLRGCGRSDDPGDGYDMASLADDVAHVCREAGVVSPVVVGHSLGGSVGVELAARHPTLVAAVVALDPGPIHATPLARDVFEGFATQMEGPDGEAVRRAWIDSPTLARLDAERRRWIIDTMCAVPLAGAAEVIRQTARWNGRAALALCRAPLLVILSRPGGSNDPSRLLEVKPDVQVGMTVGAGHFHQLEVPDQIIPMVERFLVTSGVTAGTGPGTPDGGCG